MQYNKNCYRKKQDQVDQSQVVMNLNLLRSIDQSRKLNTVLVHINIIKHRVNVANGFRQTGKDVNEIMKLLLRKSVPIHAWLSQSMEAKITDRCSPDLKRFISKRINATDQMEFLTDPLNDLWIVPPFSSRFPHTMQIPSPNVTEKIFQAFKIL